MRFLPLVLFIFFRAALCAGWPVGETITLGIGLTAVKYEVKERLGTGSMGTVYLATALEGSDKGKDFALKVIPHVAKNVKIIEGMDKYADMLTTNPNPNLVRYYAHEPIQEDGDFFAVRSELAQGTLGSVNVKKYFQLTDEDAKDPKVFEAKVRRLLSLQKQLLNGLAGLNDTRWAHSDIKPANIFVFGSEEDVAKGTAVFKFGDTDSAVRSPGAGVSSTPAFASPEAVVDGVATSYSDLFSTGASLYTLAAGELLVKGESPAARLLNRTPGRAQWIAETVKGKFDKFAAEHPEMNEETKAMFAEFRTNVEAAVAINPSERQAGLRGESAKSLKLSYGKVPALWSGQEIVGRCKILQMLGSQTRTIRRTNR